MTDPDLYFAAPGSLPTAARAWLAPVLAAWPQGDAPTARPVSVEHFLAVLETEGDGPRRGVALLVLAPDESTATIDRLVEALQKRQLAGLILMDRPSEWRFFQRHGVIFGGRDMAPAAAAAMLFALRERQGTICLLAREIELADRCQGGMRREMDRLHEELHLAANIQREFTSSPIPVLAGLEIGVLFRPVNFVSGDIFDVRDLGDGRAAFFIADAVGHGVPAALLTMVLTNSLITGDGVSEFSPADVLARLNRKMCASCFGSGRFATAAYGVIDSRSRTVTVAGAGHPMPVVLGRSGVREIETSGPLLGVFGEAEFDQATFALEPDDTLLLYTDGLETLFPWKQRGGPKATRGEFLNSLVNGDAVSPRLLDELQTLLDAQSGSLHQADDVTALCIAKAA